MYPLRFPASGAPFFVYMLIHFWIDGKINNVIKFDSEYTIKWYQVLEWS